jgi:hypothetical protein
MWDEDCLTKHKNRSGQRQEKVASIPHLGTRHKKCPEQSPFCLKHLFNCGLRVISSCWECHFHLGCSQTSAAWKRRKKTKAKNNKNYNNFWGLQPDILLLEVREKAVHVSPRRTVEELLSLRAWSAVWVFRSVDTNMHVRLSCGEKVHVIHFLETGGSLDWKLRQYRYRIVSIKNKVGSQDHTE